jgi:hypothetical protein
MTGKALSKLPSFREALVLSAEWMKMSGIGMCELAIRWRKTQTEVWSWEGDLGSLCVLKLPADVEHQELIQALVDNELVTSAINPFKVTIRDSKPPLGNLVALSWAAEFDTQSDAVMLASLPWDYLQALHSSGVDIGGRETHNMLAEIREDISDSNLDLEDVMPIETPRGTTLADIQSAIRDSIASAVKEQQQLEREMQSERAVARRQQAELDAKLAPFRDKVEKIYENYRKIEHPRRYPGGGGLPPKGFNQLKMYVENFVSQHGEMPSGVREFPEGSEIFGSTSEAIEVDFDAMQKELPFRLESRWEPGRYVWFWRDPRTNWTSGDFESKKNAIAAWASGKIRIG